MKRVSTCMKTKTWLHTWEQRDTHTQAHIVIQHGWLNSVLLSSPGCEGLRIFWVFSSSAPLCFLWLFILTCLQARERAWLRHSSFSLLCSIHTQTNQENVCINTYPHVCRFFHTLCMSAWQSPACPWFLTHWCHAVLLCRVLHVHTQRQTDTQQHTPSRQAFMTALPISWSLCCFVKSHLLLFFLFLFFLVHHFPLALTSSPTPPTSKASPIFAPSLHTFILITLLSLATFAH